MEVSGQLQISDANRRSESCVPIGLEAEWGQGRSGFSGVINVLQVMGK
jgi:hypothetical protein